MLEFDFDNSHRVHDLDLGENLIPNDTIRLGVVMDDDKYNCLAEITDVGDESFRFKINEGNIPWEIGQCFEIIFMQQTGVYKILVRLEEVITAEEELLLKVRNEDQSYKIQNRSYFRLNIYKRVQFTKSRKSDTETGAQEYKGVIENISAAGVKLVTNAFLEEDDQLNLDLSFAALSFARVKARVNRIEKSPASFEETEYYKAGVEFMWQDLSNQDELASWLNRQMDNYL